MLACEPPHCGSSRRTPQGDARIVYELRGDGDTDALLPHAFVSLAPLAVDMFDRNLTRAVLTKQSERALANLKHVLEGRGRG